MASLRTGTPAALAFRQQPITDVRQTIGAPRPPGQHAGHGWHFEYGDSDQHTSVKRNRREAGTLAVYPSLPFADMPVTACFSSDPMP
jgi:hypothetical protein